MLVEINIEHDIQLKRYKKNDHLIQIQLKPFIVEE